ncbi:hypothetical protein VRZ08_04130 [Rhodopseudomonas sp. G2_2311]|uniref:hypothetical protein n=1 Tax=Rhodopseudomonas sp. G2_2311 TaxID=3114287 RepID=UPI0039C726EB
MRVLEIKYDTSSVSRMARTFASVGRQTRTVVLVRAVNHTGAKALTQMRRVLVPQTGLKGKTIRRAVASKKAFNGGDFVIRSKGGNIRLKHFGARETKGGVSAAPWGVRRIFPHTFIKGGAFPKRVPLNMGGHVYKRIGKNRLPIEGGRSGLFIPEEMISGRSADAFRSTIERELPNRIAHELYRVLAK